MTHTSGLVVLVAFVTLLSTANGLCLLGLAEINLCTLLPIFPCNINSLLGSCGGDRVLSITLGSGTKIIEVTSSTNLLGLTLTTSGTATIFLNVGALLEIEGDLNILGATVSIAANVLLIVTGNLVIGVGGVLHVAGTLIVNGVLQVSGNLDLTGTMVSGSAQTAWVHAPIVNMTGTPSNPATITGNGGINGTVTSYGNTSTGDQGYDNSVYITQELEVKSGSTFKLAGNVTAVGGVEAFGRLHLDGVLVGFNHAHSYLISPLVTVTGTQSQYARLTGNGGIQGDVTLGDYSGIAAGNSPGVVTVGGNLLMYPTSFMEIEVVSWNNFDRYIVTKILMRNGILYVNFLNGYIPNGNDRFSFGAHQNATGIFQTAVYSNIGSVLAAYSNKSTQFIYDDPQATSYCSCTRIG